MAESKNKYEKGYYFRLEYHSYRSFFRDLLNGSCRRYDTYEEAQELCFPHDIETIYQVMYTDGNNNWYHCSDCGYENRINENLIRKLNEDNSCLWQGYYTFYDDDDNSLEEYFTVNVNGEKHYLYSKQYESLEEAIKKERLEYSKDDDCFYQTYSYFSDKTKSWVNTLKKIIVLYVDENKKIKEIKNEESKTLKKYQIK